MTTFKKAFAEGLGSFVISLIGCGCCMAFGVKTVGAVLLASLAYGLAYIAAGCAFTGISGGHFHPAVSFAALICKKLTVRAFFAYLAGQFIGAFAGVGILAAIFYLGREYMTDVSARCGAGTVTAAGSSYGAALLAELSVSAVFVLLALFIRKDRERSDRAVGIMTGAAFMAVGTFGLFVTRCSTSPAISLASAFYALISGNKDVLTSAWLYLIVPFAGAALAALIMLFFRREENAQKPPEEQNGST